MATRQLGTGEVGRGIGVLVAIAAAALLVWLLSARRRPKA
jgi:hypothetical protein